MCEKVICLAYRKDIPSYPYTAEERMIPDVGLLIGAFRDVGLRAVLTANAEDAYTSDTVHATEPSIDPVRISTVPARDVVSIVNLLNRSFKEDQMPKATNQEGPVIVNANTVRSLAHYKTTMDQQVLSRLPGGNSIPTIRLTADEDIEGFIKEHTTAKFVIKPDAGYGGKGVKFIDVGARSILDLLLQAEGLVADGSQILQPFIDFKGKMPQELRAYDRKSKARFLEWRDDTRSSKEIRIYGFDGGGKVELFPVGRSMSQVNGRSLDDWYFMHPESVPEDLKNLAEAGFRKLAQVTGARAIYGAFDVGFGSMGGENRRWTPVEFNAKMPYLIGSAVNREVAKSLRVKMASSILRSVEA